MPRLRNQPTIIVILLLAAGVPSLRAAAADCSAIAAPPARLACYEEQEFIQRLQSGRASPCLSLPNDAERLQCFAGGGATATPRSAPRSEPGPPATVTARPAGPATAPAGSPPEPSPSAIRLGVGGGYSLGDHRGVFKVAQSGGLDLRSLTGGSGPALTVDGWWDDALAPGIGVNLEYLRLRNRGDGTLDLPHGLSILTDPTSAQIKVAASADLGFANLVYRPQLSDEMAVFFAFGPGLGRGKATAMLDFDNPFTGDYGKHFSASSLIGGGQAMLGVDITLTKSVYFSIMPRVIYITGHPFGLDQRYLDEMITGELGVRLF